jgi:steroid delta-isomerase
MMRVREVACALLFLAACTTGRVRDEQSDERAIRTRLHDWSAANNRGDQQQANDIWAPGVQGWFPASDQFTTAAAARLVGAKPEIASKPTYDVTVNEVLVSGDMAVVRDTWTETRHFGEKTVERVIRSFEVWQRQPDQRWRITRWISAPEQWQQR